MYIEGFKHGSWQQSRWRQKMLRETELISVYNVAVRDIAKHLVNLACTSLDVHKIHGGGGLVRCLQKRIFF